MDSNLHEKSLKDLGLRELGSIFWDCTQTRLVEKVIQRNEGNFSNTGAVIVQTGKYTGRSPKDKYIVQDEQNGGNINWGDVNVPISQNDYEHLYLKAVESLRTKDVFVQNLRAGAEPGYQLKIRVISEKAWHSLFARNLFIRPAQDDAAKQEPEFTILHCGDFKVEPGKYGTKSDIFVVIDFTKRVVLAGGTTYAGEIKKAVFTVLNYLLPRRNVLSMHCSANIGGKSDVSLFFGLSGTGKTSLSSDPNRQLIGDDEHGWSENGIFNFEGGCYAKTINLDEKLEPLIWSATNRFGSVIENVCFDSESGIIDFRNDSLTENTRSAYPLQYINNYYEKGYAGHPQTIFFLTADASGVLPPIAKLDLEQAIYFFLSGYTSKLAGTETGLGLEPQATFSACFGAPFLPLHPSVYASLLAQKIQEHNTNVWLVNTGWISGSYGIGRRIPLPYSRAIINSAVNHHLEKVEFEQEKYFNLLIPRECPEVPAEILNPANTWKSENEFARAAEKLKQEFKANYSKYKDLKWQEIFN